MDNVKKVYSSFLKDWFHLIAFVIDDCNYNCDFCYNIKPRTKCKLDLTRLLEFIKHIHNQTQKNIFLELLGGEPTLHIGLDDFCCSRLKDLQYVKAYVFTNFSKDVDYYTRLLKHQIALSVTWHSKHDDVTGKDFINKVRQIPFEFFSSPGIRLRVLYEKNNAKNALDVFDDLYRHGYSDYLEFDLLSDINTAQYKYTYEEMQAFKTRIQQLRPATKDDYIFEYSSGEKKYLKFTDIVKQEKFNFKNWLCSAGKDCLYVHANGDIYPCESYYFATAANVFDGKMSSIYSKNALMLNTCTLCKCKQCAWSWNIHKENIFDIQMTI